MVTQSPAVPEPATRINVAGSGRDTATNTFAILLGLTGLTLLGCTCLRQIPQIDWLSPHLLPIYLLAVMLFVGELNPLLIARHDGDTANLTVSSTFAVALIDQHTVQRLSLMGDLRAAVDNEEFLLLFPHQAAGTSA